MFKYLIIFVLLLLGTYSLADIFDYPADTQTVVESLPQFNSISCKFTQEKVFPQRTLQSGGNFHFIKEKGVIFETLYPVKTTTSYTSSGNKQINEIITSIANKNYSVINKNFDLFYHNENGIWTVALQPKAKSPAAQQLKNIIITGEKNINQININPLNGTNTKIKFYCD